MNEPAPVVPTVRMKADVSSREAAIAWTKRRIRKLGLLLLLGAALSPVASGIVVGWRYFRKTGGETPPIGPFITSSLMWAGVVIVCLLIVVAIIGTKYFKFARRAGPVLERGTEHDGQVVDVQTSTRRGGGINHHKVTLVVQTSDGASVTAALEESEGTELPLVDVGAPAKVWTLEGRSFVGTSGALFEV
jgi:hypothetical protein